MKSLLFQLKVLYRSLRLPLSFIVIATYSFTFIYAVMVGVASFINYKIDYLDLATWNEFARLILLLLTLVMTLIIFGKKIKFF